jgi:3-oxoacyl-[acyl-carrier protein] reductase
MGVVLPPGLASEFAPEQLTAAVELLVHPHQRLVARVLPGMRGRGFGRIAALAGYLKTLATEVAADGITVNMVLPGRIDTDRVEMIDQANAERSGMIPEEVRAQSEAAIPAGRYDGPRSSPRSSRSWHRRRPRT